ncbi:hypothetical protein G9A89_012871 [Geosiphon pyriformis]|nr:hypothetical protein G9A89_012871 [Geosiphon pyriformis]
MLRTAGKKRKADKSMEPDKFDASGSLQPAGGSRKRKPQKKLPEDTDKHILLGAECYFENGLRKVKPYFFEYKSFAKGRWVGKTLFEVFRTEFRDRSPDYYASAIVTGLIKVNNTLSDANTIIHNQDLVSHSVHRHEPPVTAAKIKILREERDEFLIIDKPSSVPVHPTGRYHHNTIIQILQREHGFVKLFPVNRLDRLTSGLMILALNKKKAHEYEQQMRARTIRKTYVCRVIGEFPSCEIVCDKPILSVCQKVGLNIVHSDGKPCTTVFEKISYNGRTSLLRCKPLTGRTHQIRVHLQYLGYPIANDPLYARSSLWGSQMGKGGVDKSSAKHIIEKLVTQDSSKPPGEKPCQAATAAVIIVESMDELQSREHLTPENSSGIGWHYETELPEWARDDFEDDF